MSTRTARFEIVRTGAGWHARFRASNGRVIWWTETYRRRVDSLRAIGKIAAAEVRTHRDTLEVEVSYNVDPRFGLLEVREVDERNTR